jgi:HK97 family phage major capsid protein
MAITGNTELSAVKADIISAMVQKELGAQAKLLGTISDWSAMAVKGAKTVKVPKFTTFTASSRASGVAGVPQAPTGAVDTIDLDQNLYVSWLVDSFDEYQAVPEIQMLFNQKAAQAHARKVDELIIAALESAFFNTTGVAAAITYDKIVDGYQALIEKNSSLNEVFFAISPNLYGDILKLTEFKDASVFGMPNIPNVRPVGQIFGIPVIVNNLITGAVGYMYERNGVGIAFQQGASMAEQSAIEYGTKAKLVAMDQVLGVDPLEIAVNGAAAGKSALIYKFLGVV